MKMITKEELDIEGETAKAKMLNTAAILSNEYDFDVVPYSPYVLSFVPDRIDSIIEDLDIPHNFGKSINEFWLIVKQKIYHLRPKMDIWFSQNPQGFVVLFDEFQRVGYNYVAKDASRYMTPEYELEVSFDEFENEYDIALLEIGKEYEDTLPDEYEEFNSIVKSAVLEYNWNIVQRGLEEYGERFAFRDADGISKYERAAFMTTVRKYVAVPEPEKEESEE